MTEPTSRVAWLARTAADNPTEPGMLSAGYTLPSSGMTRACGGTWLPTFLAGNDYLYIVDGSHCLNLLPFSSSTIPLPPKTPSKQ